MPPQPSLQTVRSLPTLPRLNLDDTSSIPNDMYTFQANVDVNNEEPLVEAELDAIGNKIWFKTGVFFLLLPDPYLPIFTDMNMTGIE